MLVRRCAAALLALGAAVGHAGAAPLAATPISRLDLPWWRGRFEQKQRAISDGRYDLVYYGDSITQNFEQAGTVPGSDWPAVWARHYAPFHALNLGFRGDTTASLLWRIEHGEGMVRGYSAPQPKLAIVLIGANNMGRLHWPAEQTVAGIDADVKAIRAALPATRVLLLGVLPSVRSTWVDGATRAVNAALAREYTGGGMVTYSDVGRVLTRNGATDASMFVDPQLRPPEAPLHPSAPGAERIAAAIAPVVDATMAGRQ